MTWENKRVSPSSLNHRGKFIYFLMLGKRKNRSNASKDSLPSPDEKKLKDKGKAHSTAAETDEVFEALEMAEGLGSKLEAALKKLEKLDTIESRLRQMHTTLASIEENVSRLGSTVNELKESIQFNEEDISDLKLETKNYNGTSASSRNNFFTWRLTQGGKM